MSEKVDLYNIQTKEFSRSIDRNIFYEEQIRLQKEGRDLVEAVAIVNVFLFNTRGEILIQKRSFNKSHNPGLLDKSIGGHVRSGDTPDYTVMVETIQELQTPSIVLKNEEDFSKTFNLLENYLDTVSVIKFVDQNIHILDKIIDDRVVKIANKYFIYFGAYNGKIRPADNEARGVLWYSLAELKNEMTRFPDTFTNDMHVYLEKYEDIIKTFLSRFKKTVI